MSRKQAVGLLCVLSCVLVLQVAFFEVLERFVPVHLPTPSLFFILALYVGGAFLMVSGRKR